MNIVLTNLGYCMAFGTLLAKMGRVYYIFHNPTTSKKVPSFITILNCKSIALYCTQIMASTHTMLLLDSQRLKVQIKVLNDSKFVTALIYMSSILLLLLGVVVYLFGSYINAVEIVFSGAFLLSATTFACLSFIPKVRDRMRVDMW